MRRSAASMLSGKKTVHAVVSIIFLLMDAYTHTMVEFLLFMFGHHVCVVVRLRLRNPDLQNQPVPKRQMVDNNQRPLLLLRLKMLR
jgi:hypothetical protein